MCLSMEYLVSHSETEERPRDFPRARLKIHCAANVILLDINFFKILFFSTRIFYLNNFCWINSLNSLGSTTRAGNKYLVLMDWFGDF